MSKAGRTRTRERAKRMRPEYRRRHLLQAAVALVADRGLGGTRHAQLATKAKVSLSTVFAYFPTRHTLEDAVLGEVADYFIHLARESQRGDAVNSYLNAMASVAITDEAYARVLFSWSRSIGQAHWKRYLRTRNAIIEILVEKDSFPRVRTLADRKIESREAAEILMSLAELLLQLQLTNPANDPAYRGYLAATRLLLASL